MSKFATAYPQIRVAIYGILTGGLGLLALFGLITQDQVDSALGYGAAGLGALGTLLALVNVKTAAPQVDTPALADEVAARINTGINDVTAAAQSAASDFRRQVEQQLGHRLGG